MDETGTDLPRGRDDDRARRPRGPTGPADPSGRARPSPPGDRAPAAGAVQIATWNVWDDPTDRHDAIVASLARCDADVIALQEASRTGAGSQAETIGAALGMEVIEATPWRGEHGLVGNAVLSRLPVEGWTITPLPVGDPAEPRTAVTVDLAAPGGPLTMLCTHLGWRPGEEAVRLAQARLVHDLALAATRRGRAAVVCGDLNAEPGSEVLAAVRGGGPDLVDAWEEANGREGGATWDLRNPHTRDDVWPTRRIDFVLARGGDGGPPLQVRRAVLVGDGPVRGRWPSDHLGIAVSLSIG